MSQAKQDHAAVRDPEAIERGRKRLTDVLVRSATDAQFRQLLLSDSRTALGQQLGREVPESVSIAFIEAAPGTATIVLPDPVDADAELSETELEAVAGGATPAAVVIGACIYIIGDTFIW
jgi:hypothetical protein